MKSREVIGRIMGQSRRSQNLLSRRAAQWLGRRKVREAQRESFYYKYSFESLQKDLLLGTRVEYIVSLEDYTFKHEYKHFEETPLLDLMYLAVQKLCVFLIQFQISYD